MAWTSATLGEICDRVGGIIQTGPFGSQLHQSDYSEDGIPVVMPKDIIEGRIVTDGIACVASEHVERLSRHKLKAGDIVYGRRGDIGRQALIRQRQAGWLCGTGCLRLNLGNSIIDPIYLHYYLREPDVIGLIANQAIGATLPNLNTSILRSVPIRFPHLPTQQKIAAVLSAYDDLIENNLRRIKILEEMAQNLYREWFVKFRFPGHEKARFVDSPLGRIPEGWENVSLGKLTELRKDKFKENLHLEWPLLDLAKMQQRTLSVSETGNPSELTTSRIIFEEDDILFGSIRPYLHKVALAPCRGVTNISVLVIRPAEKNLQSILAVLLSSIDTIRWADQHSTGTKMPVIKWETFQTMPTILPSQQILRDFETYVHPMMQTVKMASSRNQNLRRTRDLLLPKLISGEVDVSELDITVPEETQA